MALTPKQEKFAQEVASGKSQADAYRAAYSCAASKPATVQNKAYILMKQGDIAARVAELRKPIAETAQITLDSHLARLESLSMQAEADGKWDAAIKAEIGRAKAAGIIVDKVDANLSGSVILTLSNADAKL